MKFGVQLYALRDFIAENGLEKGLEIIAAAGFEGVEFAGFYGKDAEEIQSLLCKYGLEPISAHVGCGELKESIPMLRALGIGCTIVPYIDFNHTVSYEEGLKTMREAAELAAENGLAIGYHNHAHEFENDGDVVSALAEDIPQLKLEPDVFWLAVAGIDALAFLKKHCKRLAFLHIKELGEGGASGVNPVVGKGKANIAEVLVRGKEYGVDWAILEIENTDMPMAEYLKRSYAFMKKYQ